MVYLEEEAYRAADFPNATGRTDDKETILREWCYLELTF